MANRGGSFGVPVAWAGPERRFAEGVKERVDILVGQRGDPLDRAITARDLIDSGIATLPAGANFYSGASNGLIPTSSSDDVLDNIPAPTNLSANGAFENILLTWNMVTYRGHAFTQVYRHTSDDIANATLIAQVAGYTKIYSDPVGESASYYYWVRAVNTNGEIGPFNSSTGTQGTTQPDVDYLLSELSNAITSSQLASSLATPIASISTLDGKVGDLEDFTGYTSSYSAGTLLSRISATETVANSASSSASSLSTSVSSLNTAVSNLQTSVADLTSGTTSVYVQTSAPTGTISTYSRWYDSDDNMHPYVRIDANGNGTETWESLLDPRIGANESDITDLNAEVFDSSGNLKLATASALSTLDSTVTSVNGTVTSHTSDITDLNNEVFDNSGNVKLASTSALNTLTNSVEAIYDASDANSLVRVLQSDVTSLETEVFNNDGTGRLATATSVSGLTSTVTSQGNSITTAQGDITSLESAVFDGSGAVKLATTAAVSGLTSDVVAIYDVDNPNNASVVKTIQGDVTSLESEVFNSNGTSRLATATALSGLQSDVEAIYDGTSPSLVKTIQTDITALEGQVFNSDGTARLATTSSVNSLTQDVEAIYDGSNASVVKTIQTDVTSLETAVFDSNGAVQLATTSSVNSLTNDVEAIYDGSNPSVIKTIQGDITDLESEVFDSNGTGRLATGSALTALTNDVEAIYDGTNASLVKTIQSDVTSLEGAVFDSSGNVKLATADAVSVLQTEVWGDGVTPSGSTGSRIDSLNNTITNPTTGLTAVNNAISTLNSSVYGGATPSATSSRVDTLMSEVFDSNNQSRLATSAAVAELQTEVYGSESASASRIDGLYSEIYDSNGTLALATASAFSTLNTSVTGSGGLTERIDNIAASMFVDSDEDGELNLATAEELETVETAVFPNGTANASRISQLSSAIWSGGDPTNSQLLASADFVSNINTAVFGSGTDQSASANKIDTLQTIVTGENGDAGIRAAIETTQDIVSGTDGLTSQYSVKLDNNGYVSGFGLSNTSSDGTPTSSFIVRADRFAIVNPSATNQQSNNPANNQNRIVPFAVQGSDVLDGNGDVLVPAGVYMDGAFIKNGTITTAHIREAFIDFAQVTGTLTANRIEGGTISTSLLDIDGQTLTNVNGVLKLGTVNADSITGGTLDFEDITADNLRANKIIGDINDITTFSVTDDVEIGNASSETVVWQGELGTTEVARKPYCSANGWGVFENDDAYRVELYIKINETLNNTFDLVSAYTVTGYYNWGFGSIPYTIYRAKFSGDQTEKMPNGATMYGDSQQVGTVSTSTYSTSANETIVDYTPYVSGGTTYTASGYDDITFTASPAWQSASYNYFRSARDYHAHPFHVQGGLSTRTTAAIEMKITMRVYNAAYKAEPTTNPNKDWSGDEVMGLEGVMMELR